MNFEHRKLQNEEVAQVRGPAMELVRICEQSATDYAKSVIQIGLVLNAGAIVAIPTVTGLVKDDIEPALWGLGVACSFLLGGIALSWLAAFAVYFAVPNRQMVYEHRAEHEVDLINAAFAEDGPRQAYESTAAEQLEKFNKTDRSYD